MPLWSYVWPLTCLQLPSSGQLSIDLGTVNVLFERDKAKYTFSPGSEYSLLDCLLNHGNSLGPRHPVADNNSSSSRASSPEPELEAHKQLSVLHRPASQQLTAPQSQRLHMSQCTPSPNLRVQQRSSDNETTLPSSF
ncbi:hypothetical protein DSO57_1033737 [Entomophthora muscae]|uniref:Uncharacterized protein n=1 Tax=Entomophthora muscae TaxID=34485 RepID=A0ACC2UKP0_9FUNG|nr:hypothetical protein DSO57_1033737 [Entomophthora muscae]